MISRTDDEQSNIRMTNIELQQFEEKKEQGEGIQNPVGVFTMSDDMAGPELLRPRDL
jgi:hypothetical protein